MTQEEREQVTQLLSQEAIQRSCWGFTPAVQDELAYQLHRRLMELMDDSSEEP